MKVMLDKGAFMPERAHELDAGYDIRTPIDFSVMPHSSTTVNTGVHIQLHPGTAAMLVSKSGLNMRGLQSTGLIDAGYTGAIRVKLDNQTGHTHEFKRGEKISQFIIMAVMLPELEEVEELEETERGEGGFGSTGK